MSARGRQSLWRALAVAALVAPPTVELRSTGGIFRVDTTRECSAGGLDARAECFVVGEDAHLLVGDLLRGARADRAVRVAADLQLGRRLLEGVVEHQAADQRLA